MNLGKRNKTALSRNWLTISPCSPIQRMVEMEKRQGRRLKFIVQESIAAKYGAQYPKMLAEYDAMKDAGKA